MDESTTRRKKIDPKLYKAGWEENTDSEILTEQRVYLNRSYLIAPDRVGLLTRHPKKADYILEYRGKKLAVIEAKSDEKDVSAGVEQAKLYAEMLQIRFTYATNGNKIWAIDMGVKDAEGKYIIPSKEGLVEKFPSPQELWKMTYPDENLWRDKFLAQPFFRNSNKPLRYYQEIAVTNVLNAIAKGEKRILLTMATGTGKTYTAFQICWKLFQTGWNIDKKDRKPKILFITDRNTLADQARNDFDNFPNDAMVRVNPKALHRNNKNVPKGRSIYFTIFQTFMQRDNEGKAFYMQYPENFFDFIIIDECHRGGANDESEWRELMEYFKSAVQLGMTATPRRKENANTYEYFGEPVYSYSLKQGIADGYLTPFRVKISTSNIDNYKYDENDEIVSGKIDKERTYNERDFNYGNIQIDARDEHRVKELLNQIDQNEKTIVFCSTQEHAAIIRDKINNNRDTQKCPENNYCVRVTADDGEKGEQQLRFFQDNENLRPTILTTSHKLSTGVDALNIRNIVLMRRINSIVEFKQIIGRGTRLFDGKKFFTIYDFVGANENFKDAEWDGDPVCEKCGNWPCTCKKKSPQPCPKCGKHPCECQKEPPQPCPKCGHLPCTCTQPPRNKIVVELSNQRRLELETNWEERIQFGDELITIKEFINKVFGIIPTFLGGEKDLRGKWEKPDTREALLDVLNNEGFDENKLGMLRRMLKMEDCDLLDVLEFIAYNTPAKERAKRVQLVKEQWLKQKTTEQQEFFKLILDYYKRNGYKELGSQKLADYVNIKYGSYRDGLTSLELEPEALKLEYLSMQHELYNPNQQTINNYYINVNGNYVENQNINIR